MRTLVVLSFLLASLSQVSGAVTLATNSWDVNVRQYRGYNIPVRRGESVVLDARYLSGTNEVSLAGVTTAIFRYKPLTTNAYPWGFTGTVAGAHAYFPWTSSYCVTNPSVDYEITLMSSGANLMRAFGQIYFDGYDNFNAFAPPAAPFTFDWSLYLHAHIDSAPFVNSNQLAQTAAITRAYADAQDLILSNFMENAFLGLGSRLAATSLADRAYSDAGDLATSNVIVGIANAADSALLALVGTRLYQTSLADRAYTDAKAVLAQNAVDSMASQLRSEDIAISNQIPRTPADIGAATAAQGAKADTALQAEVDTLNSVYNRGSTLTAESISINGNSASQVLGLCPSGNGLTAPAMVLYGTSSAAPVAQRGTLQITVPDSGRLTIQSASSNDPMLEVSARSNSVTIAAGRLTVGGTLSLSGAVEVAGCVATANLSHAEGFICRASGNNSHAEGSGTLAEGTGSHAEGSLTVAHHSYSHAEGQHTLAYAPGSHAEGGFTEADGMFSHAEGYTNRAAGARSHAEGYSNVSFGVASHAEGSGNISYGVGSHAEGISCVSSGNYSHAQGFGSVSGGDDSFAHGVYATTTVAGAEAAGLFVTTTDAYAYAWSGDWTGGTGPVYSSHGYGSFNVNPSNGLSGFFVGERHLGSACLADSNSFATTAQGARADLAVLSTNRSPAFGESSSAEMDSLAVGYSVSAKTNALAVGSGIVLSGNYSVGIGNFITGNGDFNVGVGQDLWSDEKDFVAFGAKITSHSGSEFIWNPSWLSYFSGHGPGSVSFTGATNGMYLGAGGKYYGDGSALTGLVATNDTRYLASLTNIVTASTNLPAGTLVYNSGILYGGTNDADSGGGGGGGGTNYDIYGITNFPFAIISNTAAATTNAFTGDYALTATPQTLTLATGYVGPVRTFNGNFYMTTNFAPLSSYCQIGAFSDASLTDCSYLSGSNKLGTTTASSNLAAGATVIQLSDASDFLPPCRIYSVASNWMVTANLKTGNTLYLVSPVPTAVVSNDVFATVSSFGFPEVSDGNIYLQVWRSSATFTPVRFSIKVQ